MKSNCFLYAWKKHVSGEAVYIAFRKSRYSTMTGRVPKPIRWVAYVALWPVFAVYAVLYTVAFETWPHFHWANKPANGAKEFVPIDTKSHRMVPPVLFEGIEKDVG